MIVSNGNPCVGLRFIETALKALAAFEKGTKSK